MSAPVLSPVSQTRFHSPQPRRHSSENSLDSPASRLTAKLQSEGRPDSSPQVSTSSTFAVQYPFMTKQPSAGSRSIKWDTGPCSAPKTESSKGRDALKQRKKSGMPHFNLLGRKKPESKSPEPEEDDDETIAEPGPELRNDGGEDKWHIEWFNSEVDYAQKKSEDQVQHPIRQKSFHWLHNKSNSPNGVDNDDDCGPSETSPTSQKRTSFLHRLSLKPTFGSRRRSRSKSDPGRVSIEEDVVDPPESSVTERSIKSKRLSILPNFRRKGGRDEPEPERRVRFSQNFGYASA